MLRLLSEKWQRCGKVDKDSGSDRLIGYQTFHPHVHSLSVRLDACRTRFSCQLGSELRYISPPVRDIKHIRPKVASKISDGY
jgi:hypothetical protein